MKLNVNIKIKVNPDRDIAEAVQEGLKRNNGYCPCVLEKTPDTKCMCKDFRDKVLDRDFEGYCHCMLFYKEKGLTQGRKFHVHDARFYREKNCSEDYEQG